MERVLPGASTPSLPTDATRNLGGRLHLHRILQYGRRTDRYPSPLVRQSPHWRRRRRPRERNIPETRLLKPDDSRLLRSLPIQNVAQLDVDIEPIELRISGRPNGAIRAVLGINRHNLHRAYAVHIANYGTISSCCATGRLTLADGSPGRTVAPVQTRGPRPFLSTISLGNSKSMSRFPFIASPARPKRSDTILSENQNIRYPSPRAVPPPRPGGRERDRFWRLTP